MKWRQMVEHASGGTYLEGNRKTMVFLPLDKTSDNICPFI